jgi:hypothetical protein
LFSRTASPNEDDPTNLLLAARQRIMNTIHQLPKYVCTQTVERKRYAPPDPEYGSDGFRRIRSCDDMVAEARRGAWQPHLSSLDRLRLDVAVTQDSPTLEREMYSWAGENCFTGRDLFDFVPEGAISTGSFASMLLSIFGNPAARFSYRGNSSSGRMLSEFEFHIPRASSEYTYVFGPSSTEQVTVAYGGTVLVDPADSDLFRLIVRTEHLPPETGACEVTQEMNYTHVRLHGGDFLLPAQTQVSIIHRDGAQAENRIEYSACHEFQGDSTVRFESPQPDQVSVPAAATSVPAAVTSVPSLSLPPGLPFEVSFPDPIDPAKAAAGDAIHGRLKTAIQDSSGKILVARGAPVNGRIMRIQQFYDSARTFMPDRGNGHSEPPPMLVIAIRLETLDAGKGPQPFQAVLGAAVHHFAGPRDSSSFFQFWTSDPDQAAKIIPDSDWLTGAP